MLKEWFTSSELALYQLPTLPGTQPGVYLKAQRESWISRTRKSSGGGVEYHISNLTEDARIDLIRKVAAKSPKLLMAPEIEHYAAEDFSIAKAETSADDKKHAKIFIVGLFDCFCASSGVGPTKAVAPFIEFFHKHKAAKNYEQIPEWVFKALPEFSARSLHRWRKACDKADILKLAGAYGNRKDSSVLKRAEDGAVALFIATVLVNQPQLKAGHIRDLTRAKFGQFLKVTDSKTNETKEVPLPKIRSFERHIIEWKQANSQLHAKLTNPDGYKNTHQMALGSQSQAVYGLNDVWEIDASPVDALCEDGRYTLYAIIDVGTRRAMFYVTKTARTEASLQMIRRAILQWGIPTTIKTDNGSDFKSKRFVAALNDLRIRHKVCPPYTPEGKPHVERVIQNIQHNLMPHLPGYIGHDVEERSQIEARKTFAQRLGVSDASTFMVSMTLEKLRQVVDAWAEDKYNHSEHRSIGMSPFQKAAQWSGEIRRVGSERALDLLLAPIAGSDGWRTITKKALRIDSRQYYGPGLELHVGKRVRVRHDPDDFSKVYVFNEQDEFLCEAKDFEAMPQDEQIAAAQSAKANQRAAIKAPVAELRREGRQLTPENITQVILDQAKADRSNLIELPRPSVVYDTPALAQADLAMDDKRFTFASEGYKPEPLPVPKQELTPEQKWWERRKKLEFARLSGETISKEEMEWLEWYEKSPNYLAAQRFEKMKAAAQVTEDV